MASVTVILSPLPLAHTQRAQRAPRRIVQAGRPAMAPPPGLRSRRNVPRPRRGRPSSSPCPLTSPGNMEDQVAGAPRTTCTGREDRARRLRRSRHTSSGVPSSPFAASLLDNVAERPAWRRPRAQRPLHRPSVDLAVRKAAGDGCLQPRSRRTVAEVPMPPSPAFRSGRQGLKLILDNQPSSQCHRTYGPGAPWSRE